MSVVKSYAVVMLLWAIMLFCIALDKFRSGIRRRKAQRMLEHAKFYLFATTCSASFKHGRRRDEAAISLLTEKIFEVKNG